MFDYAEARLAKWEVGVPEGAPEIVATINLLGELKITLVFSVSDGGNSCFEMIATPIWYCHFADDGAQQALVSRLPANLVEIESSELITNMSEEPLFNGKNGNLHHFAIFGLNEAIHLIVDEIPTIREVF